MRNIIDAIFEIVTNPVVELREYARTHNRANDMGTALEEYIKDVFSNTLNELDNSTRNLRISQTFSYLGNSNNPPDSIIRGGDAIEVKKIENYGSSLALNSSYPKSKLYANSNMITNSCRECENWDVKDIIYAVGVVKDNILSDLAMVYGEDYAADEQIYLRIKEFLSDSINQIQDVQFSETNELGRINRVDPLGITYLRIRGMWGIENPFKVFRQVYSKSNLHSFNFMCIINVEKYNSFDNIARLENLVSRVANFEIIDVRIQSPNNPAILKDAKLIKFSKE